jgi:hypothetical protein
MAEEAQIQHKTMAEVGRIMLLWLDAWDGIPHEKWQFAAEIPEFYQRGDYRSDPSQRPDIYLQPAETQGKQDCRDTEENTASVGLRATVPAPPPRIQWPRRTW